MSDEEWSEQVKEMFDQQLMPDEVDLVPMDLLGVIDPPKPCCNEDSPA